MTQRLPEIEVPASTLRRAFNGSQLPELIRSGKLHAVYRWDDNVPEHPEIIGAPAGTRSQIIRYVDDNGEFLVLVHQYLLPGGSGRPDPKRMRVDDEIWVAVEEISPSTKGA